MTCFFCQGPAHPATGHQLTPTVLQCKRCFLHFWAWYRARLHNPIAIVALKDKENESDH